MPRRRLRACLVIAAGSSCVALFAACQLAPLPGELDRVTDLADASVSDPPPDRSAEPSTTATDPLAASARPHAIVTWNLQWFLDPERGPADDARQLDGARAALDALEPDLLALQELSSPSALDALLEGSALRAAAITAFEWPQQLAIACSDRLQPTATRVLDALRSAGRAPLEVELLDVHSGARMIAIAVHAKAYPDADSWRERRALADALQAHVQSRWPDDAVILLGDLNDGLTRSIAPGEPSPYAGFVSDPRWSAPTVALERAQPAALLDHVLVSDELAPRLGAEPAVERVSLSALGVAHGASAVSDHAPVRLWLDPGDP